LKWKPVWNSEQTIEKTALWYRRFYKDHQVITQEDLENYVVDAQKAGLVWA